jgi:hypothetical protein
MAEVVLMMLVVAVGRVCGARDPILAFQAEAGVRFPVYSLLYFFAFYRY